jgi:hypothetical protein
MNTSPPACRRSRPTARRGASLSLTWAAAASMCAFSGGRSIESTMGFTALDGLPMGTRPGQIDPGVILYLIEQKKMSARPRIKPRTGAALSTIALNPGCASVGDRLMTLITSLVAV